MTDYSIITQRFNDEWRNGSTFATNPTTVFTTDLQGNVGDRIKFTQTIEISVTVNPDLVSLITYNATADATYGEFVATGLNFLSEGMYVGATLDVDWGGGAPVSVTVGLISGTGYTKLRVTKANLTAAGIVDGDTRTDFRMRLTSVPDTLVYKYGLNPNGFTGYQYLSYYDGNAQGYYLANLTGSFQDMIPIGFGIKSWNMSESVQVKYDATVSTYFFQYTIEHIFKIPFYRADQFTNLDNGTTPDLYLGTNSVTYDNGWFFGGTTLGEYIKAEIKGGIGSVGYFGENFNGYANNYEVQNLSISNADNSGVLEGTVVNTVTFQVKKTNGNWIAGTDKLIVRHSKLPTETEYVNNTTVWSTLWIYDQAVNVEGAGASSGTAVISNFTVTINADPTLLDVEYDVTYDTSEQALILNTSDYLLFVTAGADPALGNDRVTLKVDLDKFSKNLDVTGLVTNADVEFFEPFEYDGGSRRLSSFTGWDGDLGGCRITLTKNAVESCVITKAQFKIITTDGTDEAELLVINVPIGQIQTTTISGQTYQILNVDVQNSFTLPSDNILNRITANSVVPPAAGATQLFVFETGFQVPWRDWVFNSQIPNSQYDSSEPQNNKNFKTSNYSNNADGFEIFAVWDFTLLSNGNVETIYRKETYESNIFDFDTNGATYSANTKYFNVNTGDEVDNILTDVDTRVEISFTHSTGTVTLADIEGYVWMERDQGTQPPYFLHTDLDFTDINNPLVPTDTLLSGNTQYVEKTSASNLIKLIFSVNKDLVEDDVDYNFYGRIKNKTIA